MHTFVAISLPDHLKQLLSDAQKTVEGIRWQPAHQMHITLKFLGEISEKKVKKIIPQFEKIDQPPFPLTVQGWGTFRKEGRPNVIWAGVKPADTILQLHKRVQECCRSLGLEEENHSFVPHITLGRIKGNYTNQQLANLLDDFQMVSKEFTVKSFAIYESLTDSDGAIYKVIKKYSLPK